jgi:predicted ATPase
VSTDNVVDFLVSTMSRLPRSTLTLIKMGSCFGNNFDIRHVTASCHLDMSQAELDIWQAEKEGLGAMIVQLVILKDMLNICMIQFTVLFMIGFNKQHIACYAEKN